MMAPIREKLKIDISISNQKRKLRGESLGVKEPEEPIKDDAKNEVRVGVRVKRSSDGQQTGT